ncbi:unnamed protein product [Heligmosomoides polygyrus]|uniref:EB domain-containing protein n=1 Tax=Heligmosomoides polygyrus TaxID=6339 RepID=A0A183F213_HELPZ|nr:unnamed protein product [Heligmosomoides polygyrus]
MSEQVLNQGRQFEVHTSSSSSSECNITLSACLPLALKPNETGCVLDDQCRRACESTICEKTDNGSRCMCEKGRHFLFNKCCQFSLSHCFLVYYFYYSFICFIRGNPCSKVNKLI